MRRVLANLRQAALYVWVLPASWQGLWLAAMALGSGGRVQWVDGVLEVYGGYVTWMLTDATLLKGGAAAMTLGHVVVGCDAECLNYTRRHERVHVRQFEKWGPLFLPLYFLYSGRLWLQGRDFYRENPFEVEAYAEG